MAWMGRWFGTRSWTRCKDSFGTRFLFVWTGLSVALYGRTQETLVLILSLCNNTSGFRIQALPASIDSYSSLIESISSGFRSLHHRQYSSQSLSYQHVTQFPRRNQEKLESPSRFSPVTCNSLILTRRPDLRPWRRQRRSSQSLGPEHLVPNPSPNITTFSTESKKPRIMTSVLSSHASV